MACKGRPQYTHRRGLGFTGFAEAFFGCASMKTPRAVVLLDPASVMVYFEAAVPRHPHTPTLWEAVVRLVVYYATVDVASE